MNRRRLVLGSLHGVLAAALLVPVAMTRAQRVSQPIYRPLPGRPIRPGLPLRPGRFDSSGVSYGAPPGVYTVASINARENTVRLRDDDGNSADVYIQERALDVETLAVGDVVAVDFLLQGDSEDRLEAASIEKLEVDTR